MNSQKTYEQAYRAGWNDALDECCRRMQRLTEKQKKAVKEWIKDLKDAEGPGG